MTMNTERYIVDFITLFMEQLIGILFFCRLFPQKIRKHGLLCRLCFFFLYGAAMAWQEVWAGRYLADTYLLYLVIHLTGLSCYAFLFCVGKPAVKLFMVLIFTSVTTMAKHPASLLLQCVCVPLFPGFPWNDYSQLLGILLLIPLTLFLLRYRITAYQDYPFSYYVSMFVIPALNISIITMLKDSSAKLTYTTLIGCFSLCMELLIYYMIYQSTEEYEKRTRLQMIQQQQLYQEQHMEQLQNIVADYHQLRHDMKNHFVCMDRLLSQEHYKDLKEYFYSMSKEVYALDNQIETGNEIVNQVINIKYAVAHRKQIPMEFSIVIPHQLSIPSHLLCSLLSNLLDNAIEASEKIREPRIQVKMNMVKDYLSLTVSNRIEDWQRESALSRRTTKQNPQLHGIGWKSIQGIVKRYNGISDFTVEGNICRASVMLEMPADIPVTD